MEISDVRVRLVEDSNERLRAVCTVTLDNEFVIRDVKIVDGTHGLFVAMPSRKLTVPCPKCRTQNHVRARFCNECGQKLPPARVPADENGREKAHRDVAHPITAEFRQTIQERVLAAYQAEFGQAGVEEFEEETEEEREPLVDAEVEEVGADEEEDEDDVRAELEEPEDDDETDDDDEKADDDDDDLIEDDGEPISEYDTLIAALKGGRGRAPSPPPQNAPRQGGQRGGQQRPPVGRPAPANRPADGNRPPNGNRRDEGGRREEGGGERHGGRRRGRGGRGRGDREEQRPAAGHGVPGRNAAVKDEVGPVVPHDGGFVPEHPDETVGRFGAGMQEPLAPPPSTPRGRDDGGRGRGRGEQRPRGDAPRRDDDRPRNQPPARREPLPRREPAPAPPPPKAVEPPAADEDDSPFGAGIV